MNPKHHIVFFTGAGISKESGLSTFRDANGLWNNYKLDEVASLKAFETNPEIVLNFYNERRNQLDTVKPNLAHSLIAQLEKKYKVSVITQNVDDLHERAGSSNILHLHGELRKCRSSLDELLVYDCNEDIKLGDKATDGSQLRPYVVWFGEAVSGIEKAISIVQSADLFIIIGTTMMVQPAASLLLTVPYDVQTVYIDPNPEVEEGINLLVLKEKATTGMQLLVDMYLPY
ncbi:MAG: NAD-dependent deacylase [Chitinophagales bacterium]|nr:NAD-dependent deacylase [Chitinophagales bacterium]